MIPSRGKHREFAQVSTQQSLRSFRDSRRETFAYLPHSTLLLLLLLLLPLVPPLTFPSLRNLSLSLSSLPALLSVCSSFLAFSLSFPRLPRWNVTTFAKAFDLDAGGWRRRGRRIRIKRTDCRKLVENPDEIREPPRRRAAPFLLSPIRPSSCVQHRDASFSFFFPLPRPRVLSRSTMPVPHPSPVSLNFITARRRPVSRCNMIVANEKVAKRENRLRVTNVDWRN